MTEIEIGTSVIHPSVGTPMPWRGEADNSYSIQMIASRNPGESGLRASMTDVVPATVPIPEKSPRVTAEKVGSTLSYGPRLVWYGYLDGEPVARNKSTKREALAVAHRTLAVRDFHKEKA